MANNPRGRQCLLIDAHFNREETCGLHKATFPLYGGSVGDPPWRSDYAVPGVSSQVRVSAGPPSGLAWSLYKCAALWMAVYGPSATATETLLGTKGDLV